jgi:hypothetical protein
MSGAARGRSEPSVEISGLLLHELQMIHANHGWPNDEKITICIRSKFGAIHQNKILTYLAILQAKILDM